VFIRAPLDPGVVIAGGRSLEFRGAEYRGPKLRDGVGFGAIAASPLSSSQRVWGSDASSPSGVWVGAPAEIEFGAFWP